MRKSNIAFTNLRAEMEKRNILLKDIAASCGYNRDTLARKLSKKSAINLDEAFNIQRTMFPDLDVFFLFDGTPADADRAEGG